MKVNIILHKKDLRNLVVLYIQKRLGDLDISPDHIKIVTKSTQNYKAEWEDADFEARYEGDLG